MNNAKTSTATKMTGTAFFREACSKQQEQLQLLELQKLSSETGGFILTRFLGQIPALMKLHGY